MKRTSWFTWFTSAYGVCWLVLLLISLLTMSRINLGIYGLAGFPVIAAVYAVLRCRADRQALTEHRVTGPLTPDFARFLAEHPPMLTATPEQQTQAYGLWVRTQRRNPER